MDPQLLLPNNDAKEIAQLHFLKHLWSESHVAVQTTNLLNIKINGTTNPRRVFQENHTFAVAKFPTACKQNFISKIN
jgi:hypothetical protein